MDLSYAEVRYIAKLARLELSEKEVESYTAQLSTVLEYMQQLDELNLKDVEPLTHVFQMQNVFREDKVAMSLPQKQILQNGPEVQSGHFKVPQIL